MDNSTDWLKHPQTILAKSQWDAVAHALGADPDVPELVLAAAQAREPALTNEQVEFYGDVLITALAGSAYWAEVKNLDDAPDGHERYAIRAADERTNATKQWKEISAPLLYEAVRKLQGPFTEPPFNTDDLGAILVGAAVLDAGLIDGDAADCLLQFALYGELVYG